MIVGQKVWSTWAQWADFGYLLARTEPFEGSSGITAFILDMTTPGIDVRPLREMTGTTDFNEVFFDEVRVPLANVIGNPGEGWKVAGASLAEERTSVGGGGSGSDPVLGLIDVARHHRMSGRPAIENDAVRQQIGALAARSRIQKHLGQRMATKGAQGALTAWDAPLSKIWFSELNLEITEKALELQGPRAMVTEGDDLSYLDGQWQDAFLYARAWTIAGGSNEIMRNLIAERGLGLPRESRGRRDDGHAVPVPLRPSPTGAPVDQDVRPTHSSRCGGSRLTRARSTLRGHAGRTNALDEAIQSVGQAVHAWD